MVSALDLRGVSVRFEGSPSPILDAIDLCVEAGELHALIGPNGSGKTTIVRAAAGLVAIECGAITLAGRRLETLSTRERARAVALVPQGLEAIPPRSVEEFIDGGRYPHAARDGLAADRDAVQRAIHTTSLGTFRARPLASLSGGERQRALVARALAQDTPVLIGDEPTASLDPSQQLAMLDLFATAARDGRAVLVVTHDLNLASQYADRISLLSAGRVIARGTPREVLTPDVLGPVFGERLHHARFANDRPLVVPERSPGGLS